MTAIVAFAANRLAFIAGDTKRAGGLFPTSKLYVWSDRIVFGQAGNALQLSLTVAMMQGNRQMFPDGIDGLREAYGANRKIFYDRAPPDNAGGNLLVAVAGDNTSPGKLYLAGFADDDIKPLDDAVSAIGVTGLSETVKREWDRVSTATPVALDFWAMECIKSAIGPLVDWPIELLIARPTLRTQRFVVKQRLAAPVSTPQKIFSWAR